MSGTTCIPTKTYLQYLYTSLITMSGILSGHGRTEAAGGAAVKASYLRPDEDNGSATGAGLRYLGEIGGRLHGGTGRRALVRIGIENGWLPGITFRKDYMGLIILPVRPRLVAPQ